MATSYLARTISESLASKVASAVVEAATAVSISVVVAVMEPNGLLKCLRRMDGALAISNITGPRKAYTALLGVPSGVLGVAVPSVAGLESTMPGITPFPGGLPIRENGVVIGSVGVSGGTVEQDHEFAVTALRALGLTVD